MVENENFNVANMNHELPYEDNFFSAVVCIDGIEHLERPFDFIRECYRVTKPGGRVIISTPNINDLRQYTDNIVSDLNHKFKTVLVQKEQRLLHLKSSFEQQSFEKRFEFIDSKIKNIQQQFQNSFNHVLRKKTDDLNSIKNNLLLNHPEKKDKKGFVQLTVNNKITSIDELKIDNMITIENSKISINCKVISKNIIDKM